MENELPFAETSLATIRYTAVDRVEVRFKPGQTLTVAGLAEIMTIRQRLGATGKHRLIVFMCEEMDFDLAMITTDHYAVHPQSNTEAVAWVTLNDRNEQFTRMYLSYWPSPFPSAVFRGEEEARAWLEAV
ncbi:MAG TPA: hypothetical protein VKG92_08630 [Flavobacteriales bacterium]|nr:hypothetical protein [Flavobacteriales bacterium]